MPLFPMLRIGKTAASPLPPGSLHWIAGLYADDAAHRAAWLEPVLPQAPWLAFWSVCEDPFWREAPPADAGAWAQRLVVRLWDRLRSDLVIVDVPLETLDGWRAAWRRVRSLQSESSTKMLATRRDRMALFSEGEVWCYPREQVELPPWLRDWLQQMDACVQGPVTDPHADAAVLAHKRELIARQQEHAPWTGADPFVTTDDESTGFVAAMERLAGVAADRRALERDFQAALEQEKLEALKEFAYGYSHEVNNPLANIASRAETLLRGETDPDRRRALATMQAQAFRAHEMVSDLMLFARPPRLQLESVDLFELMQRVMRNLEEDARRQSTEMIAEMDDRQPARVSADPDHLAAALRSVCLNSLEALRGGGRVKLKISQSQEDQAVGLIVEDDGPGIPEELRPRIFDPYFSGREAGRGLGLGLSKAWAIMQQHGGRIEVEASEQGGARFLLWLPQRPLPSEASTERLAAHE